MSCIFINVIFPFRIQQFDGRRPMLVKPEAAKLEKYQKSLDGSGAYNPADDIVMEDVDNENHSKKEKDKKDKVENNDIKEKKSKKEKKRRREDSSDEDAPKKKTKKKNPSSSD